MAQTRLFTPKETPDYKVNFEPLKKYIAENKLGDEKEDALSANKYYLAEALLESCKNPSKDHDPRQHIKNVIASCYEQNNLMLSKNWAHHLSKDYYLEIIKNNLLTKKTDESFVIPKTIFNAEHSMASTRYTPVTDKLHDIFVDLYMQCGGKTTDNNLPDSLDEYSAYSYK